MAKDQKHTKIPRFEIGTSRIAKPGFSQSAVSKLAKQQIVSNAIKAKPETERTLNTANTRKILLCRFGAANKIPMKELPILAKQTNKNSQSNQINETVELSKGNLMNITKPVIADSNLTRSNTFVCDKNDIQENLLCVTHNVSHDITKERTFKRSLSPIPGDPMNAAKRKHMQFDQKVSNALIISTPLKNICNADNRFSNDTKDQLSTFMVDKANPMFEQTFHSSNAIMRTNRTDQHNDGIYAENCHSNENATENGADAIIPNVLNKDAEIVSVKSKLIQIVAMNNELMYKKRFSLGLELPECTLDCSLELCDSSATTSVQDSSPLIHFNSHSYEIDESLGILTPDQMIEFLDTNASKIEFPSSLPVKIDKTKCRIDQTPSPEDLPLDPIDVKVDTFKEKNITIKCELPPNWNSESKIKSTSG